MSDNEHPYVLAKSIELCNNETLKELASPGKKKNVKRVMKINWQNNTSARSKPSSLTDDAMDHLLSFDTILTENIKFGRFQKLIYLLSFILYSLEGVQALSLPFLLPTLKKEWNLSDYQQYLLISVVFIGMTVGTLFGGVISDSYGRRLPLILSIFFINIFLLISGCVDSFSLFLIARFFFAVFTGLIYPIINTYLSEITPSHLRGKYMLSANYFFSVGEILCCVFALLSMTNFVEGNFRVLILWPLVLGVVSLFLAIKYLKESPRFLLINNRTDEALELMYKIIEINQKRKADEPHYLRNYETLQLLDWALVQRSLQESLESKFLGFKSIFHKKIRRKTLIIWLLWFTNVAVYYGIMFSLNEVLQKLSLEMNNQNSHDFFLIVLSISIEIPATLCAYLIVEKEKFGRKNSVRLCFIFSGLFLIFAALNNDKKFFFPVLTSRFFMYVATCIMFPLTSEIYTTKIRATGMGFANCVGRIGGILIPWMILILKYNHFFIILAVLSFLAGGFTSLLPYDTTGIELDNSF